MPCQTDQNRVAVHLFHKLEEVLLERFELLDMVQALTLPLAAKNPLKNGGHLWPGRLQRLWIDLVEGDADLRCEGVEGPQAPRLRELLNLNLGEGHARAHAPGLPELLEGEGQDPRHGARADARAAAGARLGAAPDLREAVRAVSDGPLDRGLRHGSAVADEVIGPEVGPVAAVVDPGRRAEKHLLRRQAPEVRALGDGGELRKVLVVTDQHAAQQPLAVRREHQLLVDSLFVVPLDEVLDLCVIC
mmetsp:Transcript_72218/g.205032  ORF Transcript_72218/g.205032 Transcript_72218/m.205032 type:complete len:246 (-) Transcript_72218:2501-3238(-)